MSCSWKRSTKLFRTHTKCGVEIWPSKLRVRTLSGKWRLFRSVLWPGAIVPDDGSRDSEATVDINFHNSDQKLLRSFGVKEKPYDEGNLFFETSFESFRFLHSKRYAEQDNLPHNPNLRFLNFASCKGVGPLEVLALLSKEGNALYTDALLNLDASFETWTLHHTGTNKRKYPKMPCESLTIHMLRKHGSIRISSGFVPLADALGPYPKSPAALHKLFVHPKAEKIKAAFDLMKPMPEFFGQGDPVPLIDVWPGLDTYLPPHLRQCRLIFCERILIIDQETECVFNDPDIYLVGTVEDDEKHKLKLVASELELPLNNSQIEQIVERRLSDKVKEHRAEICLCPTNAERLRVAVGEEELRAGLPSSLLAVLEYNGTSLTGTQIAEAAIVMYHTDALKQYKRALEHLDPPTKWAGSPRAVEFVQSLGFSSKWAGERSAKRDPFEEVEGPYVLPNLHDYQRTIVGNVRNFIRDGYGEKAERRGMISMPTGSGKTRVAVQAIVESIREDGFLGGILWVADRDELCEQAVVSWKQVWSSIGSESVRLRISRMWAGQPAPIPTNDLHVIVATIQTLNSRVKSQTREYEFLAGIKLVVFDEAHRSITQVFSSVLKEIGLTRFKRANEPFMLGLTATPYRGHDTIETARLVHRYGSKRLDSGAFANDDPADVIRELQKKGVLAQADHVTIEGETFPLETNLDGSPGNSELIRELDKWLERKLPWLPPSVEEHIAMSTERTKRIVEAYFEHIDPEWSTLIFATSVKHAQTVAALFHRRGIRSRAVSGNTETAVRRRVVEEFRSGEIKALVN